MTEMQERGWAYAANESDKQREARYERSQAVRKQIIARLDRVLDRIIVASTFKALHSGAVAQLMHALRFAQYGDNEPEEWPSLGVTDDDAKVLIGILANMFDHGYRPRTPVSFDDED